MLFPLGSMDDSHFLSQHVVEGLMENYFCFLLFDHRAKGQAMNSMLNACGGKLEVITTKPSRAYQLQTCYTARLSALFVHHSEEDPNEEECGR
jgi:hypothetical protein